MSKYLFILVGATALMGGVALLTYAGPAESAREQVSGSTNAAPRYWQAMTMLDTQLRNQSDLDLNIFTQANTIDFGKLDGVREFVSGNQSIVRLFITASMVPGCDFVDNTLETDGPGALLPHLAPMRRGVTLLIDDALIKMKDGRSPEGIESLAAAFRMARHTQNDGILLSSLVSMSMFQQVGIAMQWAFDEGVVDGAASVTLAASLSGYAVDDPFAVRRSITREREVFLGWIRREFAPGREPARQAFEDLRNLLSADTSKQAETLLRTVERGESLEPYLKLAEHYYDLCLAAWNAPDALEQLERLSKQVGEGTFGPMTSLIGASWERAYKSDAKAKATLISIQDRLKP